MCACDRVFAVCMLGWGDACAPGQLPAKTGRGDMRASCTCKSSQVKPAPPVAIFDKKARNIVRIRHVSDFPRALAGVACPPPHSFAKSLKADREKKKKKAVIAVMYIFTSIAMVRRWEKSQGRRRRCISLSSPYRGDSEDRHAKILLEDVPRRRRQ